MIVGWSRRRLVGATHSWLSLSVLLALIVGITYILGNKSVADIVTSFLILSSMVVAYHSFMGNSGIVSFGHVAFFGIGAYSSALLNIPPETKEAALPALPPILRQMQIGAIPAIVIAAAFAGVIALVIGLVISRMQENAMGISTFALLVIVHTVIQCWDPVTRGGKGLYNVPRVMTPATALIGLMLIIGVALLFKASPMGLRLLGARDDKLAAQSLGIHLVPVRLFGWVLSAILMGAGGAMWAHNVVAFGHHSFFFRDTFAIIAMLIIGGQASVTGSIVGCAVITIVSELMRYPERGMVIGSIHIPELYGAVQLTIAVLILATLILRPSGILGSKELALPIWQWIKNLNRQTQT